MLELKGIKKDYKLSDLTVHALKDIDLCFRNNEFAAILGPSGCGKTTLLNLIGGLDSYTSGDLFIDGISTKNFKSRDWDTYRNQRIGFIFQSYNLIPHLSVLANVEMALTLSGVSQKEKKELSIAALEKVGLKEQLYKKPMQLSGGQMQRVAIARAIVNNPEIILADEPTGALDSKTSIQVIDILKDIAKDKLVIMVTHNAKLAKEYSTRTINLLDGLIISDDNPLSKEEYATLKAEEEKKKQEKKEGHFGIEGKIIKEVEGEIIDGKAIIDEKIVKEKQEELEENVADKKLKRISKRKKKSSMNFFAALALSARNLFTKKLRTFLTIFAGSIGIIGIALVLSISNGFSLYMEDLERTTLSSLPINISELAVDYNMDDAMKSGVKQGKFPNDNAVTPFAPEEKNNGLSISTNRLTQEYVDYIKQMEKDHPDWTASITYERIIKMNLISKTGENSYQLVNNEKKMGKYQWWQELLEKQFVNEYYDLLSGKYPKTPNEIVLIVNPNNQIREEFFNAIGYSITPNKDGEYPAIAFDKFIGKEFRLVLNNNYYTKNANGTYTPLNQEQYEECFNDGGDMLKIVGVLRVKKTSDLTFFNGGIGYTPQLTDYVLKKETNSNIAKEQIATYANLLSSHPDNTFNFNFLEVDKMLIASGHTTLEIANQLKSADDTLDISGINETSSFLALFNALVANVQKKGETLDPPLTKAQATKTTIDALYDMLNMFLPKETKLPKDVLISVICPEYTKRIQELGATTMPKSISIYPATYAHKDDVLNHLEAFNEGKSEDKQIHCTDLAKTITKNMQRMIDIISYVLIAFAAISLIVSSIMIAIITYISVLERTKEIGVLRSLGARKIDVSNVFNAETFIIGASSGVFGVILAVLLDIPLNILISNLTSGMVTNIAKLNPLHGLLLVVLSIVLTVISGLIPAIIASKKDPVEALRSN